MKALPTYQECGFLDIRVGHWGRQTAPAKSYSSHIYGQWLDIQLAEIYEII